VLEAQQKDPYVPRTQVAEDAWGDDHTQFARLLAEIRAVGLTSEQTALLRLSMDIDTVSICEILDRAESAWERIKASRSG